MLSRIVPGPLVRWFARPYVAGESLEAGLDCAAGLRTRGLGTTLDLLGEDVTEPAQVAHNVSVYEAALDALAERFPDAAARPSVSLKPSAFTIGPRDDVRAPLEALAQRARERGVALTVDMEDRRWTDWTIDASVDLFRRGFDVGTVLQTRLHRTEADLARIPEGMRLRLVIGIYPEPDEVATSDKRVMKERMLTAARALLERDILVEFATHDEAYVERFVDAAGAAEGRYEVQMLLGVPRAKLHATLLERGVPVRIYVPFAVSWEQATSYLRRRMAESPSVAWLAFRNLFSRGGR